MNGIDFFTDPVLRAPTWGTLFMCIASSLIGVFLFLKKKTLLSESLSHATYPGIVIGSIVFGLFFPGLEEWSFLPIFLGALCSSLFASKMTHFLQEKQKMSPDSALCFVLALFFGIGIVATSFMQMILPSSLVQIQTLLFGQSATMVDKHIYLYGFLTVLVSVIFYLVFHPLQALSFDRLFSESIGLKVKWLERVLLGLLLFSLILGIRSVGVVLMSGMVIAPAVAARQFTNHLHKMLFLAAFFGALSGILGNILSVLGTIALSSETKSLSLPTGPMIVLVSGFFAFLSLLFAPERGLVFRKMRVGTFHLRCLEENILKGIWKKGSFSKSSLLSFFGISSLALWLALRRLVKQGWIVKEKSMYRLTADGNRKAASIVRLHRLWELYLADTLKLHSGKVHKTAEEMEHIITPDIEERLTRLLSNPTKDPHQQPIPNKGGV
jgi:manganese/zinc/iron transport system permease protein